MIITDTESGNRVMDIDLTWFLTLQAIGERHQDWSDQEYLDRQDDIFHRYGHQDMGSDAHHHQRLGHLTGRN